MQIVEFRDEFAATFSRLNREWLESYSLLEDGDLPYLADPRGSIIDHGGAILVAVEGASVVGTVALLRQPEDTFELAKLVVDPAARGRGIGRLLVRAAIARATASGATRVVLSSSSRLAAALRLYESLGFRPGAPSIHGVSYAQADVYMELRTDGAVLIRDMATGDLPALYLHQLDPEATRMAAFPARDEPAFMRHWERILADPSGVTQTITTSGQVVGYVTSFDMAGERQVGYWIDREHWGRGIASRALALFLLRETARPLHAHVAKSNVGSIRVLEKCGFRVVGEDDGSAHGDGVEEWIFALPAVPL